MLQIEATFDQKQLEVIANLVIDKILEKLNVFNSLIKTENDNQTMTVAEVAKKLSVNQYTVRNWIKKRKLKAVMSGKKYLVQKQDLDKYLKRNERERG